MKATQLEIDEVVDVREDRGRIGIEPVRPRTSWVKNLAFDAGL